MAVLEKDVAEQEGIRLQVSGNRHQEKHLKPETCSLHSLQFTLS
jgi:hypothetical protein